MISRQIARSFARRAANIGELAIQVFAMEIPAYPRKEGVAFDAGAALRERTPVFCAGRFSQASTGNDDT